MVTEKNCAESFDKDDPFHMVLNDMSKSSGEGHIIAIVWSTLNLRGRRLGVVVIQQQYGLSTRKFTVDVHESRYVLRFLSEVKSVQSDYFEEIA